MAKYLIQVGADTNVRDSDKLPSEYRSQEFLTNYFTIEININIDLTIRNPFIKSGLPHVIPR